MATAPEQFNATAYGTDIGLQWTNNATYFKIWVQYNKGSGWVTETDTLGGSEEHYTLDSVDANVPYTCRVAGYDVFLEQWSAWSNTDTATCFSDALTEAITITDGITDVAQTGDQLSDSITVTDSISEVLAYVDALTESITVTDTAYESQSITTDYSHYLLSETGEVYEYHTDYTGYAGSNIASTWITKQIDFSDQYPDVADKFKCIDRVILYYVDKTADATISISYSVDNGSNWTAKSLTFGDGDDKAKFKIFFMRKTAYAFDYKIENASASDKFQWAGMDIYFKPIGKYMELS